MIPSRSIYVRSHIYVLSLDDIYPTLQHCIQGPCMCMGPFLSSENVHRDERAIYSRIKHPSNQLAKLIRKTHDIYMAKLASGHPKWWSFADGQLRWSCLLEHTLVCCNFATGHRAPYFIHLHQLRREKFSILTFGAPEPHLGMTPTWSGWTR